MNVTPLPRDTVHRIIERACRAPSVHNTQPWRWRVDDGTFALLADRARQLMRVDPDGRDLLLSCGAALHHLRVAARAEGFRALVLRVPHDDEDSLARVELVPDHATPQDIAAAELIERRRTDRRGFSSWQVPEERLARLVAAAEAEGVGAVMVTDPARRRRLVEILARAGREQQLNWAAVDETAAWTGPRTTDGVPAGNLPRRVDAERRADPVPIRYPSGTLVDDSADAGGSGDDESGLVVICTRADDPVDRLRAGEALSAVLLAATGEGLATVPLSQATEVHQTRHMLQDEILDRTAVPQVVVRVGWRPIAYEPVPPTPRRPLRDVLVD